MSEAALKNPPTKDVEVVIKARVREVAGEGFKFAGEAFDTLNEKVCTLIREAAERCTKNGRVTIQPQDF